MRRKNKDFGSPVNPIEDTHEGMEELPGVVCTQLVRCGRANCRCTEGHLHGPYYYRFWRENGRLKKEYVSCKNLEKVKAACARRREREAKEQEIQQINRDEMRQWFQDSIAFLRQVEAGNLSEKRIQNQQKSLLKKISRAGQPACQIITAC